MKSKKNRTLSLTDQLAQEFPELKAHAEETAGLAELASALIQLRARAGLRQVDLAKLGGLPATLISELENGHNKGLAWRTLTRLATGAGARIELSFVIDPANAGQVNVCVVGEYTQSTFEDVAVDAIAELINVRNAEIRDSGTVLAA